MGSIRSTGGRVDTTNGGRSQVEAVRADVLAIVLRPLPGPQYNVGHGPWLYNGVCRSVVRGARERERLPGQRSSEAASL
jgi:hypothetical protein